MTCDVERAMKHHSSIRLLNQVPENQKVSQSVMTMAQFKTTPLWPDKTRWKWSSIIYPRLHKILRANSLIAPFHHKFLTNKAFSHQGWGPSACWEAPLISPGWPPPLGGASFSLSLWGICRMSFKRNSLLLNESKGGRVGPLSCVDRVYVYRTMVPYGNLLYIIHLCLPQDRLGDYQSIPWPAGGDT